MRYKILVKSNYTNMLVPHRGSRMRDRIVTIENFQVVGPEPYPSPYGLLTNKPFTFSIPNGPVNETVNCYKTADDIVFNDCNSSGFELWYYVPEIHPLFNVDMLEEATPPGLRAGNDFRRASIAALKVASKSVRVSVEAVMKSQ